MNLSDYLRQKGALPISKLREMIGAKSDNQIRQWQHGYGGRIPGPLYAAAAIERATDGAVRRQDLRPDDWHLIWPELAEQEVA